MADGISRSQRQIVREVMSVVAPEGFVLAGGVGLIAAGLSDRPTHDLDAFSASCDDVGRVADQVVDRLRSEGHLVDVHHSDESFARMTVSTGKYRRTTLVVELGRDVQMFAAIDTALGPALSRRELAANKMLAAFGRREPRDLVDLMSLARVASMREAVLDASAKDLGFARDPFVEMVNRTLQVRDDLWPAGSDPAAVRDFAHDVLLDPELFA